jgi:hypothetical protein
MRALLLFALLAAAPAAAQPAGLLAFGAWRLGCDPALSCRAIGFANDPDAFGQVVILDRDAGPEAAPRLTLGLGEDPPPAGTALTLAADDTPLGTPRLGEGLRPLGPPSPIATLAAPDDGALATLADAALHRALLAALPRARTLTLRPADGRLLAAVPLAGAAEALAAMDAAQGRTGTTTALAAPGPRPAATVPPAPTPPARPPARAEPDDAPRRLTPAMRAALAAPAADCFARGADPLADATLHRVAPGLLLVLLPCDGGAYNTPVTPWLWREGAGEAGPAPIETPPGETDTELMNAVWHPADGTLSAAWRGRRFDDCGNAGAWRWDGTRFALLEWRTMPLCRGLPPDWWFALR